MDLDKKRGGKAEVSNVYLFLLIISVRINILPVGCDHFFDDSPCLLPIHFLRNLDIEDG
jgi:hypothetical protein